MNAAERIKAVRKAFHMKQFEFAECIGVTSCLISSMELGKISVSRKTAEKIKDKLFISPAWLLYGVGSMFVGKYIDAELVLNNISGWKVKFHATGMTIEEWLDQMNQREQMRDDAPARMIRFRNAFQINQNQLAKKLGYTRAYISAVEKGIQRPSRLMAGRIEAVYGVSAAWLLYGAAGQ